MDSLPRPGEGAAPLEVDGPVVLLKLSQKHKQVLSLVAQGVDRQTIAQLVEYTPEYITMLARQPVCQEYLREMVGYNDTRLIAMTERSVDVISDAMRLGTVEEQLKAAKLQLTAIGKVGRAQAVASANYDEGRLERIAQRLVALQSGIKERVLNESDGASIQRLDAAT